jgi:hypothetical protein
VNLLSLDADSNRSYGEATDGGFLLIIKKKHKKKREKSPT